MKKNGDCRVFVVDQDHMTFDMFLKAEGFSPTLSDETEPDLVVFTGGADIDPQLYGEKKLPNTFISPKRDAIDLEYWNKWPAAHKVGICRGGQFCNVMSGGSMWQDVDGHGQDHRAINLLDMKPLAYHAGDAVSVTSTHHQMMIAGLSGEVLMLANKAKKYSSAAEPKRELPAFDTEVVWYEKTKSLCYQPHPEYNRLPGNKDYFFALIRYLMGYGV